MLSLHELSLVASTCSTLREAVEEFLRHELASLHLDHLVANFCEKHGELLTKEERGFFHSRPDKKEGLGRAQQYRMINIGRQWKKRLGQNLRRINCASPAVWIPHRDNDTYFKIRTEEELGRELVELKTVCWLEVAHLLEGVAVGQWEVSLRLKLTDRFTWPHQEGHMSSWKVDDEEVKVGRQWWRALKVALSKERLEVKERVMGKELRAELEVEDHHTGKPTGSYPNITINYINQASYNTYQTLFFISGWVKVVLPAVTKETEGNIAFSFRDTECPWWKGGIVFDFIELKKIE